MRTVPLKRIVGVNLHTLPETTEPGFEFRYLDIGAVGRGQLNSEPEATVFASAPSRARRLVRQGDTIISTVRTYLRAVWPVRASATDLVVSTGFAVLTPTRSIDSRYLGWLVQSDVVVEEVVARSVGVSYPAINPSDIGTVRVPLPPLAHQRAIADYLDRETARIDALIEKKRQMVRALELRLGVLAHDLTTATGREVPLRRVILQIKTGTTPPADQMERLRDGSLPWYSPGDVGDWLELQEPSRTLDREAVAQGWVPRFAANSTLIVGIGATAGSVAHLDCDGSGNQQMTCLVPGPRILPRFLSWQLFSRTEELRATAPFTTLPILNNDFLKAASLFIPTIEEQAAIVGRLDELAKEMQRVVQLLERQVELLLEHRQALITAAVTGELDVAGVAA